MGNLKLLALLGFLCAVLSLAGVRTAEAANTIDPVPRTAVISAFQPELAALRAKLNGAKQYDFDGVIFTTGTLEGKPVVLFLSGISMVNAAMTTQLVLNRFRVRRIVFSGIAGGVDPDLSIGDGSSRERPGRTSMYRTWRPRRQ